MWLKIAPVMAQIVFPYNFSSKFGRTPVRATKFGVGAKNGGVC